MHGIGIVAIGRNEGERLQRCLRSCPADVSVVYVDSGSSDGSQAMARARGVDVIDLDLSQPFTMARARNAGFERLVAANPGTTQVQFVDGDCELRPGWIEVASAELAARPEVAVVCGRRRERHPDRSVYNQLADMEWNTPVGDARACGGDALMRVEAFRAVGGFTPGLIAGEEPELCVRLRARGWRICRLDAEMTLHDIAMLRFGQWWRRSIRNGWAFAEGASLHGRPPERHWVRETRSALFWGLLMPGAMLALALPTHGLSLLLTAAYLLPWWRARSWRMRTRGDSPRAASRYAAFCMLAKLPEGLGMLRFRGARLFGQVPTLIEYKGPGSEG